MRVDCKYDLNPFFFFFLLYIRISLLTIICRRIKIKGKGAGSISKPKALFQPDYTPMQLSICAERYVYLRHICNFGCISSLLGQPCNTAASNIRLSDINTLK